MLEFNQSFLITILIVFLRNSLTEGGCPNSDDIKPCTCNDEGLQCLQLNDTGLEQVFVKSPNQHKFIRRVWIFQTNLTSIKKNAFGEYILRDLFLDLNKIHTIHSGAFGRSVDTLQTLTLSRNSLTSFPFQELKYMNKLKQLGLAHNELTRISALNPLLSSSLESIDLSNNKIITIEAEALSNLSKINMIDLSKNSLREITKHSLLVKSSTRSLIISLRNNQITSLASDTFGNNHPVILDLSRNKLNYLDEYVFAPLLMNNTLINVAENPFSCYGCQLYRWLLEFDKEYINNLDNFACLNDDSLEDLTMDSIGCVR